MVESRLAEQKSQLLKPNHGNDISSPLLYPTGQKQVVLSLLHSRRVDSATEHQGAGEIGSHFGSTLSQLPSQAKSHRGQLGPDPAGELWRACWASEFLQPRAKRARALAPHPHPSPSLVKNHTPSRAHIFKPFQLFMHACLRWVPVV